MSKSACVCVVGLLVAGGVAGAGAEGEPAAPRGPDRWSPRDVICSQRGIPESAKFPSDSIEVANECEVTSTCTIIKATWWGGYMERRPTYPDSAVFNVRFYGDLVCTPTGLLAEFLGIKLPGTFIGNDPDELPCYRYDLEVAIPLEPGKFWMGIQALATSETRLPPKWGRLGDEIFLGCGSQWRFPDFATWFEDQIPHEWDASQEFEVEEPTPARSTSWGALRGLYR
ncbi:MAG: hypothetical protein FJY88_01075 [Candidatus Eisenbacteria bacterium]|nr:hypothetical protein [Candidatus Eisenbacteria bacterium]